MLHTSQGIKLSDKEYHELHFVVCNDTRFKFKGLDREVIDHLKCMMLEADIDLKQEYEGILAELNRLVLAKPKKVKKKKEST